MRTSGLAVDRDFRRRVHRRLGWRLGKFAPRIERLSVRFEDVNGPRGGIDVACRIKAVISGVPSVVVTELAGSPVEAFDLAGQRIERVVRRTIGRARERGRLGRLPPPARRREKQPARKATAARESSTPPRRSRPSRKSTRRSANRAKHGNKLTRRERRRVSSPNARRAQAAKKH